jgi:hypothetical protein
MIDWPDTPLRRHLFYYIALKYVLIVPAGAVAFYVGYRFL